MSAAGRYLRTVRHLEPGQVGWRLVHEARLRFYARAGAVAARWYAPDPSARWTLDPREGTHPGQPTAREREIAALWRRGRVSYHGVDADRDDWAASGPTRLWGYRRHYHEELVALAACGADAPDDSVWLSEARRLVDVWAAAYPPARAPAWEPYPVARRVLAWTRAGDLLPALGAHLAPWLAAHVRFLNAHLERHLLGNHLLCDAAALVAGAAAIDARGAEDIGRRGAALLEREVAAQVLPDGGYAERSASYHATVLDDVLTALALARRRGRALRVEREAVAMTRWLAGVVRPDGSLPWLNDAAPDAAPPALDVLARASQQGLIAGAATDAAGAAAGPTDGDLELPHTGWSIVRPAHTAGGEGGHELLFERGLIGPPEQPGHGHEDALSYELTWGGVPVITDSGVTTYTPGSARSFERSPRAHATVSVDGEGPDELWASFRVGGRGRVDSGPPLARAGDCRLLRGRVTSWRGWQHHRGLIFWPGRALVILDVVRGAGPEAIAVSHLPLDPRWTVLTDKDDTGTAATAFVLGDARGSAPPLRITVLRGRAFLDPESGSVGRGFGRPERRPSASVRLDAGGRAAYAIIHPARASVTLDESTCRLVATTAGASGAAAAPEAITIALDADGLPS